MSDYTKMLLGVLITLVVIASLVYGYALFQTSRNLQQALARVPKPAAVVHHEQIHASGKESPNGEIQDARLRINAYQSLFEGLRGNEAMQRLRETEFSKAFDARPFYLADGGATAQCLDDLAALHPEIEALRSLVSEGGPYIDWDVENSFGLNSDGFHDIWMCQTLLHMSMVAGVAQGESGKAVADATALLDLAKVLADDPRLRVQLDRYRILYRLFRTMQLHCPPNAFSDGDLAALISALRGRDDHDGVVTALSGERYVGLHSYENMVAWVEQNNTQFANFLPLGRSVVLSMAAKVYASPLFLPHHNNQKVQHAYLVGLALGASALPYYQSKETWNHVEAGYDNGRHGLLHQMYRPYVGGLGSQQAGHETRIHLLRLALGLELYQRAHEEYPEALVAVAQLLPDGLPVDPFCGEAYRYARGDKDGFVLYGVGWNLVDDGGTKGEYGDGDMVWTVAGTEPR